MALEVFAREVEEISILDLVGRLTTESEMNCLSEALVSVTKQGKTKLLLNLKEVTYLASEGAGLLVAKHAEVKEEGGELRLFSASKPHIDETIWTELGSTFTVYDNEETAVNSFFPDREVRHFDILEFVKSEKEEREASGGDSVMHSESKPQADASEE